MTWYTNRKFLAPIIASVVSILLAILQANAVNVPLSADTIEGLLSFIWFSAVAILIGDVGYDWIGEVTKAIRPVLDDIDNTEA